jgi:hypothetical protein
VSRRRLSFASRTALPHGIYSTHGCGPFRFQASTWDCMKHCGRVLIFGLALACLVTQAQEPRVTVIIGATLIDGTTRPPIQDAIIVIDRARIRQVGARAAVAVLRQMLAVGVRTIFNPSISLKDYAALKVAAGEDTAPFARFFGTGPIVSVKGDFFAQQVGAPHS